MASCVGGHTYRAPRRCESGGVRFGVVLRVGRESWIMSSRLPGNALHAGAVELDRINVLLARVVDIRGKINEACVFIDSIDRGDFEITFGELALQLCPAVQRILFVEGVEIKVSVSVTPARPQEPIA